MSEPHLRIFYDRSILVDTEGRERVFHEGKPSAAAMARLSKIREALSQDYLRKIIEECREPDTQIDDLPDNQSKLLEVLVDSVTSEVGRALVGLTVMQLCIKCIEPDQCIRLHKSGRGRGAFSWADGIPMRALDKPFITPILREFDLLRLNADGFMMTRSLAENYPYSKLYKAAIRGARTEWLEIVDLLENGSMGPEVALKYLITLLINRSGRFLALADLAVEVTSRYLEQVPTADEVVQLIKTFVEKSSYSARVFEISLHALFQVLEDRLVLTGDLIPLSQMRSANKKHGNVGDIEVTIGHGMLEIVEAWDAKYGKTYLRDELEELSEKMNAHPSLGTAGFVVDGQPDLRQEILERIQDISELHDVEIHIVSFDEWVHRQMARVEADHDEIARDWIRAFVESLCQRRRGRAPIDEPSDIWVTELIVTFKEYLGT